MALASALVYHVYHVATRIVAGRGSLQKLHACRLSRLLESPELTVGQRSTDYSTQVIRIREPRSSDVRTIWQRVERLEEA